MSNRKQFEQEVNQYFSKRAQSLFEESYCIFCNWTEKRSLMFVSGTMKIVKCKCGFIYNSNQPGQDLLDKFYEKSDAMNSWALIKESYAERLRQEEKYQKAIEYISGSNATSVLDVGCGTGMFLALLKTKSPGMRCLGTDTNESSLQVARSYNLTVKRMKIDDLFKKEPTTLYDCITLWGVLEHVKAPIQLLRNLETLLNPDGFILICVPNIESDVVRALWEGCFTFCPQHLWYFSKDTLSKALTTVGYRIKNSYTIEPEAKQILRREAGFNPYDNSNDWHIPKLVTASETSKEILAKNNGYKIIMVAKKIKSEAMAA